jgi:DNA repair protein RadC
MHCLADDSRSLLELLSEIAGAQPCEPRLREVGLARLSRWTAVRMQAECEIDGTGASRLAAAFELGRRVERERALPRARFPSPRAVWEHRLLRELVVSEGTLNSSLVHPRDVFAPALREGAGALIVVHNHPSGDPEPSIEDLAITRRLHEAGELLGLPLVDHVIVADGSWVSLRERTVLAPP